MKKNILSLAALSALMTYGCTLCPRPTNLKPLKQEQSSAGEPNDQSSNEYVGTPFVSLYGKIFFSSPEDLNNSIQLSYLLIDQDDEPFDLTSLRENVPGAKCAEVEDTEVDSENQSEQLLNLENACESIKLNFSRIASPSKSVKHLKYALKLPWNFIMENPDLRLRVFIKMTQDDKSIVRLSQPLKLPVTGGGVENLILTSEKNLDENSEDSPSNADFESNTDMNHEGISKIKLCTFPLKRQLFWDKCYKIKGTVNLAFDDCSKLSCTSTEQEIPFEEEENSEND